MLKFPTKSLPISPLPLLLELSIIAVIVIELNINVCFELPDDIEKTLVIWTCKIFGARKAGIENRQQKRPSIKLSRRERCH